MKRAFPGLTCSPLPFRICPHPAVGGSVVSLLRQWSRKNAAQLTVVCSPLNILKGDNGCHSVEKIMQFLS